MNEHKTTSEGGAAAARDRMRASAHPAFAQNILRPIFELHSRLHFFPLIDAHRAWLIMLAERRIVPAAQAAPILRALDALEREGPDSVGGFDPAVEFYYLHMERALIARVQGGESIVGNLNLGRTRPEPLNRMVMRNGLIGALRLVVAMRRTLLARAAQEVKTVMPGYTHLLHAQPTTLGHYLLAICDHLGRDTQRFLAAYQTTDQCTLGCGAMSGTSLPVDRDRVRELLGFSRLCENTIDSVSAADHVVETAGAITSVMSIVGRLAQDLYVWSSQEFSLIDVTDPFASPSSLMPQKKNALVLEYVRSRTARAISGLASSYAVLHNVGYMDSEEVELECYRGMYECFELLELTFPTMEALVSAMQPDRERMRQSAAKGFSSVTALAELIQMTQSMSYRTAHRVVARAVLLAVERGLDATGIDPGLLDQAAQEAIGKSVSLDAAALSAALDPVQFVEQHRATGGPAPAEVRRMIEARREPLEADKRWIDEHQRILDESRGKLLAAAAAISA